MKSQMLILIMIKIGTNGELKKEKGIERTKLGFLLFSKPTKKGEKINWLGIIAVFNITFSIVGFKLFRDQ